MRYAEWVVYLEVPEDESDDEAYDEAHKKQREAIEALPGYIEYDYRGGGTA